MTPEPLICRRRSFTDTVIGTLFIGAVVGLCIYGWVLVCQCAIFGLSACLD